jgi:stage III sporulation protein AD
MLALVGVVAAVILRQWKSDLVPLIRLAITLIVGSAVLSALSPLLSLIGELGKLGGAEEYVTILLKALGVAVLTHICGEICRSCGENAAAAGVELGGKAEILLLSLPLIRKILSVAGELFGLGE